MHQEVPTKQVEKKTPEEISLQGMLALLPISVLRTRNGCGTVQPIHADLTFYYYLDQ